MGAVSWQSVVATTGALRQQPVLVPVRRRISHGLGALPPAQPLRMLSGGAIPSSRATIRTGDSGTVDTLKKMGELAVAAAHDPEFVDYARALVRDLPSKAYAAEARRVFDHVRATVRYVHDPAGLENTADPRWLQFLIGSGDCDDHSVFIAALGMALGMGAAFRTVSTDCEITNGKRECPWRHVYAVLGVPSGNQVEWVPADTAEGSYFGWEPSGRSISRVRTWVIAQPS